MDELRMPPFRQTLPLASLPAVPRNLLAGAARGGRHAREIGLHEHMPFCKGSTAQGPRHEGKAPGDQHTAPPLDDNCFADFKWPVPEHQCFTCYPPKGGPRKFSLATPKPAEPCFDRVWAACPTDEKIIQNIDAWPDKIAAIVEDFGVLCEKKVAKGWRKSRAYTLVAHAGARAALEQSIEKFGGP